MVRMILIRIVMMVLMVLMFVMMLMMMVLTIPPHQRVVSDDLWEVVTTMPLLKSVKTLFT